MPTIMSVALSMILIKPAELKDLLGSCGADDIYYYACGALNDSNKNLRSSKIYQEPAELTLSNIMPAALSTIFNKTYGALRTFKILRS
jgi:hypothetical protein